MRRRVKKILAVSLVLSVTCVSNLSGAVFQKDLPTAEAATARQVEKLDRGLTAVKTNTGVLVSWRLLGTEAYSTTFNVYRDGSKAASNVSTSTNYLDTSGTTASTYSVVPVVNGKEGEKSASVSVWGNNYLDVKLDKPAGGTNAGGSYTYSASDASTADLDGDGQYEIILKWDPSNAKDNSQSGYTGNVYLDAYKLDGTKLWRIDLGCNIRAGAHYTQFMAYDLDGDGKAEVACKTAPGSKDGTGAYVKEGSNNQKDYRNSNGYVLSGEEYLTVFEGQTGKILQTINYEPARGTVNSWGDNYGNRVDRFLAAVAYLDGKTPSLIMCRGYYTRAVLVAYTWNGSSLSKQWTYDTGTSTSTTASAYGQGSHSLSVADVDNDGYDEIVYGSAVIDHKGSLLNSTGHGHGDALHVSDFNKDGKQEIFMVHESNKDYGAELRDGATGKVIAKTSASGDVGRGVMANITSASGAEFWSSADNNLYSSTGKVVGTKPSEVNFATWWDGDLQRELLDKTYINKFNESTNKSSRLASFSDVHSNNSTKATPCLQADLLGDWREEVVMAGSNDTFLRIYTTNIATDKKLYTLMHDIQYREAVAWQNVAYNQPPHTSYYIGSDMSIPVQPSVYAAGTANGTSINTGDYNYTADTVYGQTWNTAVSAAGSTSSTSKSWMFNSTNFINLGRFSSTKAVDGLELIATSAKTMQVKADSVNVDNTNFTHCLALGGQGNTSYRAVKVPVSGNDIIHVVIKSSGSENRSLMVANSDGTALGSLKATPTAYAASYVYTGNPGYLYLYSSNSNINIYKVQVDFKGSSTSSGTVAITPQTGTIPAVNGSNRQTANTSNATTTPVASNATGNSGTATNASTSSSSAIGASHTGMANYGKSQKITNTITVKAGETYDGKGIKIIANGMGDGGQGESQEPIFKLMEGATLKNVIIGAPGCDGVHCYGNNMVTNVTWEDVGEDALTVKGKSSSMSAGTIRISNCTGSYAYDKLFQVNAPCTIYFTKIKANDMGKFVRQNGDTKFQCTWYIDSCSISKIKDSIARTDSSSTKCYYRNLTVSDCKNWWRFPSGSQVRQY